MSGELWILGRRTATGAELPPPGSTVVIQDLRTESACKKAGLSTHRWDDFFPYERLAEIQERLADLRSNWHRTMDPPILEEALQFQGIQISEILEYGLTYVLVDILRSLEIVNGLWNQLQPEKVRAQGLATAEESVLRTHCKGTGVPFVIEGKAEGATVSTKSERSRTLHALTRWYRMRRQLSHFRHTKAPLRILYRENHYSRAVIKTHARHLAALEYRRGGKQLKAFLKWAGLFSTSFRELRANAQATLAKIRAEYDSSTQTSLVVSGTDLWPHLKPHIDTVIHGAADHWQFANGFATGKTRTLEEVFDNILYSSIYLDSARPEAVVVSQDSWDLDKIMVACARKRGVKTVSLQHGVPGVYYPLYADHFMAWGDTCAEFYRDHGEPPQRVVVTGRPRRDYLTPERVNEKPLAKSELGIPDGARVLLYIGQPSTGLNVGDTPMHWELQLETLFAGTRDLLDSWVVIRPHPTEDPMAYQEMLQLFGHDRCLIEPKQDLLSLINTADAVILRDSTVSLDTIQLSTPIVVLDRYYYPIELPFDLDKIPVARTAAELRDAIERTLGRPPLSPESSRFLHAQVAQDGARACQAVYDALVEMKSKG